MMFHNMRKSPLSELKVRQAVDIALDRTQLTQALSGGTATRSFFPQNTPYYLSDTQLGQLGGDKSGADTLLDAAGWVKNTNGLREKNGVALTLKLVAYPQRPGLVTMQPVIKQTLEALGITVNSVTTSGTNWDELDAIMAANDFDLLEWAQHTLPAGDPQFFLNDFFRVSAGNNRAGLNSTAVDSLIDALSHAAAGSARVTASANAEKAILDLVPVSILMTPAWHVGVNTRLSQYQPYGADYYVINSDFGIGSLPPVPTTTTTPAATTATTSAAPTQSTTIAQARQVTGSLTVAVSDPASFASNPAVKTSLQQAIADNLAGISSEMVEIISVSVDTRRLSVGIDGRRLSGAVTVQYRITIPASATNVATPTTASMQASQSGLKSSLETALQTNGVTGITVSSVVANTVTFAFVSTTPVNNETDSAPYGVTVSGLLVASLLLLISSMLEV
jgi:hypothetical protein